MPAAVSPQGAALRIMFTNYKGLCPFDLAKGTIVPLETRVTAPQGGKKQGESPAQGGIFKGRCPLNGVYKGQRPLIMNSQSKPKGLRLYRLRAIVRGAFAPLLKAIVSEGAALHPFKR